MELNRAQLLVHADMAIERFRVSYDIPADVRIKCPGPNKVLVVDPGNVNCILVRI